MESKESLLQEVNDLTSELLRLKSDLSQLQTSMGNSATDLGSRVSDVKSLLGSIKDVDSIIGRRYPRWYMVEIPFEYGDTEPKTSTIEIGACPFLCTQIQSNYLITDTDSSHFPYVNYDTLPSPNEGIFSETSSAGRSFPCSAYVPTITTLKFGWTHPINDMGTQLPNVPVYSNYLLYYNGLANLFCSYGTNPYLVRFAGWNYPEFDFEISVLGSGRHWTNGKIPSAALFGGSSPLYLAQEGIVEGSDRLRVTAHPVTDTINTKGIVRVVFFGYEIDTDLKLSDILGY